MTGLPAMGAPLQVVGQHDTLLRLALRRFVRHRLATSPLLRDAVATGGWQIVKWHHLRAWLASESLDLGGLEPYVGLDPLVERSAEQLGLFERPDALP